MEAELAGLDDALPHLDWVDIAERRSGAIELTPLDAAPEPRNLRRIKNEVVRRRTAVPLIDVLKEAVLRTGCLQAVSGHRDRPPSARGPRGAAHARRLRLRDQLRDHSVASAEGHGEDEIRYVRRRYLATEAARAASVAIADATFAARDRGLWGEGPTSAASDSTHFRSRDQNLFTERHSRYGGRGILVYRHVERGSVVVHSQ